MKLTIKAAGLVVYAVIATVVYATAGDRPTPADPVVEQQADAKGAVKRDCSWHA